ncbi:MAG: 3-oxoacyl-[acyl-carrier-protein] synthase III C-terminal domain-containing protein [Asticcacaulis sp.]
MDGTQVMAFSLKQVAPSVERALAAAGVTIGEIDHVILHQANAMMLRTLGHKIKARDDQMIYAVKDFGNTSSTSIPLAICDHLMKHPPADDQTYLLCGFGCWLVVGRRPYGGRRRRCATILSVCHEAVLSHPGVVADRHGSFHALFCPGRGGPGAGHRGDFSAERTG